MNLIQPGQLVRFRANNNPDRLAPLAIARVTEVAATATLASKRMQPIRTGEHLSREGGY